MPVLLVHLKVAEEYAKGNPVLKDNPEYLLGNIIPDAVSSRGGNDEQLKAGIL